MLFCLIAAGLALAAAIVFGLGGCGGAPEASDPVPARSILETALESWKRGDAPKALRDASPPVIRSDHHEVCFIRDRHIPEVFQSSWMSKVKGA